MTIDVIKRVCQIRPPIGQSAWMSPEDPRSVALLERVLSFAQPQTSPSSSGKRRWASLIALVAAFVGLVSFVVPGGSTASAQVTKAAQATAELRSGRATMMVAGTQNGNPNDGTVILEWNTTAERYQFNYPSSSGSFETRVVNGRVVQSIENGPWAVVNSEEVNAMALPDNGGLAGAVGAFVQLSREVEFEEVAFEEIDFQAELRHYRAIGDLTALDSPRAGFVFGTNGARDAVTTSLEVWVGEDGLIRRVRSAFAGSPDGYDITAVATTELYDLGDDVAIDDPTR
jgi:hypothetical protein